MPRSTSETAPYAKATRALKRKLGEVVMTEPEALYRASFDGMKLSFMPEACVCVKREEEIGDLLRLANRYGVPVTTRGGASSLTGSAAPVAGGWVLDMSRLNRIRIDRLQGIAHVQAGAVLAKIQQAAEKQGWMYPPDPSSVKYCTIGGTIACNAGGLRGAKYGVTRDYILSLEGFLPSGERVSWGRPLRKWAVGYNMRDLWVGSEGTLGVVTSASLRLIPTPKTKATFLAAFKNEEGALRGVRALAENRMVPVALEFLDSESVSGLERYRGTVVFEECPGSSVLLVEVDGDEEQVARQREFLREWADGFAVGFREAAHAEEAQRFWDVRRGCSPAMFAHGDSKLNEDIIVPLQSQLKLIRFLRKLRKSSGLHIPTFGHAADGNFHVNIMYYRDDPRACKAAQQALKELMSAVVDMGGAISGEHGIGLAKSPYLRLQYGEAELAAMQAIKQTLDPNGILNPGKIFEPYEVWKKRPEKVRLAWDHR